jgi:hypothetical protein
VTGAENREMRLGCDRANLKVSLWSCIAAHTPEGVRVRAALWPIIEAELKKLEAVIAEKDAEIARAELKGQNPGYAEAYLNFDLVDGSKLEQAHQQLEATLGHLEALVGYHEQRAADRSDLHPILALACPICASTPYHAKNCPLQAAQNHLKAMRES